MAIIQVNMRSSCLGRQVRFNAVLPIDAAPQKPLKTLYLLHGYMCASTTWFTDTLDLGSYANAHGIAIIMPDGENHFYVDAPNGEKYSEFIGRELVEFTRRVFPLSREREDTMIGGISMGGYGAVYNGMKYSDVFGHIIGISPANIIHELPSATVEPNEVGATRAYYEMVFGELDNILSTEFALDVCAKQMLESGRPLPDLYFACGWNDMLVRPNRVFHAALKELGIEHIYEEGAGGHEPAFFNPHFDRAINRICPLPEGFRSAPAYVDEEKNSPFYKGDTNA